MENKTVLYVMDLRHENLKEEEVLQVIPKEYHSKVLASKNDIVRKQELYTGYLLNRYLSISKDDVLKYNTYGKPYYENMHFNISHSGDYVVLAKSTTEVGVDIEKGDNISLGALKRVLSEEDYHYLETVDISKIAFEKGRFWTEVEAIIKAMGMGFHYDPRHQNYKKDWYLSSYQVEEYVLTCAQKQPSSIEMIFVHA